jgi:NADPH-dependent 2,4-dienoyl-CoA reductase/sulfur reductase-like enzyme/rhodanese-related sulfurtransferase
MADKKRIIVIGGSAAGPKAAARARRLDQNAEIILFQKDPDLSMASCGYPYYAGGFFDDRNLLLSTSGGATRTPLYFLNVKGVIAKPLTEVTEIDREKQTVTARHLPSREVAIFPYDRLIIATGSTAKIPHVPGRDLKGITTLKTMEDVDFLRKVKDEGGVKRAVVIGGGLVGVESCEALRMAGVEVTIIELLPQILTFLDWQLAKVVESYIESNGVKVMTGEALARFLGSDGSLTAIELSHGSALPCELAVVATGVRPNVDLARKAGLDIGKTGGIVVSPYMKTSDPHIYAAGDCTEQHHLITGGETYAPYGDLANLEGRVAAENAVFGDTVTFPGTILSGVCKIFEYAAGSTGLSESRARELDFHGVTSVVMAGSDKPGFMKGKSLISKMVVETESQRILGFQCIGPGDVSKQVAQAAIAIQGRLTIRELVNLDLPYAPPFTLAIDNFIACAHVMENKLKGRFKGISAEEVKAKVDRKEGSFLLDVRGSDEFEAMRLGIGETLIPAGALRRRLNDLPQDKDKEIIVYCRTSLRAYEAAFVLEAHGWKNVRVMEGSLTTWPYAREK